MTDTEQLLLIGAVGLGAWLFLGRRGQANSSFAPQGNTAQSGGAGVPRTGAVNDGMSSGDSSVNPALSNWANIVSGGPVGITRAYVGGVVDAAGYVFSGSANPPKQSPEQAAAYERSRSIETQQFAAEVRSNRDHRVGVANANTPLVSKFRDQFQRAVKLGGLR